MLTKYQRNLVVKYRKLGIGTEAAERLARATGRGKVWAIRRSLGLRYPNQPKTDIQ
jgi:hypothetical protein